MMEDGGENEYSRPEDCFDDFDDGSSDDENNNDSSQSGKNGIVLPSHLSHISESSEDLDEESESIPSLKEQSFRSNINQEELLRKETEAVKQRMRFQVDGDRQSWEGSVKQVDVSKRSLADPEKSLNKSFVSDISNKNKSLRFATGTGLSEHSLKRTVSKQNLDNNNGSVYSERQNFAAPFANVSTSKISNNSNKSNLHLSNTLVKSSKSSGLENLCSNVPNSSISQTVVKTDKSKVVDYSRVLRSVVGSSQTQLKSSNSKVLNKSNASGSSIIASSFQSPKKTGGKTFMASTPLTGKTISPGNFSVSTINSDLTNETTINGEIINRALRAVNIDEDSSYMTKKVLQFQLPPMRKRYVLSEPKKKTPMVDELVSRTENLKPIYQNENMLPKNSESISVQKSQSTSILREKPRNSRTSAIQSHENVTAPSNVIAISPSPVSHFGFVAVKDSLTRSISVLNLSDKKIQIRPELKSETFFLKSRSTILMPKQETEFQVQFMPEQRKHFSARIYFYVGEHKFHHKLIGFGGAAECILMNPKLKPLQTLQYFLKPQDPTSFFLTMKNIGERSSFMHIVAVNSGGEILDGVKFSQQRFCLDPNHDECKEKTVRITVPQSVLTSIEERLSIVSQSSAGYSTKNPSEKYLFDLKIYWGDERLRERAKKYILLENVQHPKIGHIYCTRDVYTATSDREVELLEDKDLTIQDVEMLKTQMRIFTVKICDDRVNASRPTSRQQFRSQSEDMGLPADYYVPRNSLDVSMGETLMSIYSTNQTLIPKGSKPIKKK